MKIEPNKIFEEYQQGINFKTSIGDKGLYEQSKINERFYLGDQWHGAKCGTDRPLVRCDSCGADSLKRLITGGAGFRLAGAGWARDGYASVYADHRVTSTSVSSSTST